MGNYSNKKSEERTQSNGDWRLEKCNKQEAEEADIERTFGDRSPSPLARKAFLPSCDHLWTVNWISHEMEGMVFVRPNV
jgi:hypothetical protein